jgi:xanthine/CO dehydrogenase XdhC/CoxF family maturation factor
LFDLTQKEIERLHGPVGLSIGSRTPPEIAVAILAHMIAVRNLIPQQAVPLNSSTRRCVHDFA